MGESEGIERLFRAVSAVRSRLTLAAGAASLGVIVAAVLLLSVLPTSLREARGALAPLVVGIGVLGAVAASILLARRIASRLAPLELADEADEAIGLGAGDVRAALELGASTRGTSPLAALHRDRVAGRLTGVSVDRLLPRTAPLWRRRATRSIGILGLALGALVVSALVRPEPTWSAVRALGSPWRTAFPPALPPMALEVEGGVARGGSATLSVRAAGRVRVTFAWREAGAPTGERPVELAADGTATVRSAPIEAPTRMWIEDEHGMTSDTQLVRPLEPLLVQDLRVRLEFPAYLGRETEEHRGQVPPLVIPAGTTLQISGEANLPLVGGALRWRPESAGAAGRAGAVAPASVAASEGGPTLALDVDGAAFATTLVPERGGAWTWSLEASESVGEPILPDPIRIVLVPDAAPDIQLLFPAPDTILGPDRVMPVVVDVEDDIGLRRVLLRSWRSGLGADRADRARALAPAPNGARRAVFRDLIDRSGEELLPGDTVFYRFEAHDGNPARAPGRSEVFILRVPTFTEIRDRRAERMDDMARDAEALEEAVDRLSRAASDAARRAEGEDPETGFETTEEARGVLDDAERAAEDLAAVDDELAALQEELESSAVADEALAEQLERLSERYQELLEAGLTERIEELAEALQDLDPEAVRQALEDLAQDSDWLREQLEQTLGLLEEAALDQGMKAARAEAEDLAEAQRELVGIEGQDPEDWAARQEDLAQDAEALSEALSELEERLAERGREAAADSAGAAGRRTDEARGEMRSAAEAARQGAAPESGSSEQSAERAAEAMERAAEALGAAQQTATEDSGRAAAEALGQARAEALSLAEEEGRLADATRGEEAHDPETWRARQSAVRQGLDNLLDRLAESGTRAAFVDRETGAVAGEVAARMDRLLERLAEDGARRLPSRAEAEGIQDALNQLAFRLLASEQAARAAQQQGQGEQAAEQMASLAQQQQGVTQESSSLLMPGPRPAGDARRREEVARRQQEVAEELREMEDPEGELLGRPEEMAREAEELARRLRDDGPSQETLERQRRLFRRMLDAGRSLEDEDLDPNRRESRTGEAVPREAPEIDPELLRGRRFPLPPEALLREIPIFYRPLIFEYFDRLNRPERPPEPDGG